MCPRSPEPSGRAGHTGREGHRVRVREEGEVALLGSGARGRSSPQVFSLANSHFGQLPLFVLQWEREVIEPHKMKFFFQNATSNAPFSAMDRPGVPTSPQQLLHDPGDFWG